MAGSTSPENPGTPEVEHGVRPEPSRGRSPRRLLLDSTGGRAFGHAGRENRHRATAHDDLIRPSRCHEPGSPSHRQCRGSASQTRQVHDPRGRRRPRLVRRRRHEQDEHLRFQPRRPPGRVRGRPRRLVVHGRGRQGIETVQGDRHAGLQPGQQPLRVQGQEREQGDRRHRWRRRQAVRPGGQSALQPGLAACRLFGAGGRQVVRRPRRHAVPALRRRLLQPDALQPRRPAPGLRRQERGTVRRSRP